MWYAKSEARKHEMPAEKKLRQAWGVVKWMPYLLAVAFAITLRECSSLAKHPNVEHLFGLMRPIGFTLYLLSYRQKANITLKETSDTWHMALFLLGALLMGSGASLRDIWHHKQMFLFHIFGGAVLAGVLCCLALFALDVTGFWHKARHK